MPGHFIASPDNALTCGRIFCDIRRCIPISRFTFIKATRTFLHRHHRETHAYGIPLEASGEYQPYDTSPGYQVQPPLTPTEENAWGVVMPLGAIFIGFVSPLIVWLIFRERSPLLDLQGRHALNWTISYVVYWIGAWILTSILIGYLIMAALIIFDLVVLIIAAAKASDRQAWRYPLAIQFFNTTRR